MKKITVSRPQKIQMPFSKGKILIDGEEREVVKAGKTVTFEVSDEPHEVKVIIAAMPPLESNALYIEQTDGDTALEIKIKVPLKSSDPTVAELTKV